MHMNTPNITPRDQTEQRALGTATRITAAIALTGTAIPAILAAIGGLTYIADHLPLLISGLTGLISGGLASYIAVRRISISRRASTDVAPLLLLLCIPLASILQGCVAMKATSTDSGARVWAMGWGGESTAQLANVDVKGPGTATNLQTGVSFDSAGAGQSSTDALRALLSLGAVLAPMHLPGATAISPTTTDTAPPPDPSADTDSAAYNGLPDPNGNGIYGRPACTRCQAYIAIHPTARLINIDTPSHRAAMWSALRAHGFTGPSVTLPVEITATAYTIALAP